MVKPRLDEKELKQCPFCGEPAGIRQDEPVHRSEPRRWKVWCKNGLCYINPETYWLSKREAILQWNTRKPGKE